MKKWSLPKLLEQLHNDIERSLSTARESIGHPTTMGDATERVWLDLLQSYLPKRYHAEKAHVVDSKNQFSQQMDIVIFDRQYSPFIFDYKGLKIVPAESVYAVFECKQSINGDEVKYAQKKIESVRKLFRTSLPIPHLLGKNKKEPHQILGGLLTFESDWTRLLGPSLIKALERGQGHRRLDLGCIAAHGIFGYDDKSGYSFTSQGKPATAFLFNLIARLQQCATVPMIDVQAYSRWLTI